MSFCFSLAAIVASWLTTRSSRSPWLYVSQRQNIAGKGRTCTLGCGKLCTHVPGEVGVGRLPGFGLRVRENQITQFGNDLFASFTVEGGDERQIDRSALVEGDEQP